MSLTVYKKKRNFEDTPEPRTTSKKENKKPVFVVQKHNASHLHFDFRLEDDEVLKSWAVPKGPSMNSKDKRLAVMVEDHPVDYAKFEGTIPEGNYGAGTVEIWDSGTWKPLKEFNNVDKSIKNGLLEFTLKGKKLKGDFVLVKTKSSYAKEGWLLIKKDDKYAVTKKYDANLN